nr:putative ribonuclease H-like domain-containing protein [Tanacetum cinerariifolium]
MCDKKNKVLFTDTECLVLSSDFMLLDENQVLLRVPRQNNMYSFNLENIVSSGGLACLITKVIVDESNKWHKRLGHVDFKNLNKLVKGNLVSGLPSKIFQNDHTCVACHKGKQHKASWIKKEYSNARTLQQNGVAERKNIILIEAARTMLADSFLPNTFWAKAPVTTENKANKTTGPKEANNSTAVKSSEAKNGDEKLIGDIEILKKFDFMSVKNASTLIETKKPLVKDAKAADVDVHLYRSMIGSLMYLTASRHDIMYVVCACSRFQVTLKTSHLQAVKRIFRYLKGQQKLGLWYPRESVFDLEAYSDSDYAGANLDRKSITEGCQFLGRRLISWQCKKRTIVATLTTEAEYVAAASCRGQILWIQNQMLDYDFNFMNTKIYIDNESTICIVKNPVFHSKTKHIEIRHHFIRDAYEKKLIHVLKIHTVDNVADLLTKAFDVSRQKVSTGMLSFIGLWTFYHEFIHLGLFSPKMRRLGKEHVSKQGRKKVKTGTNIEEGTNYVVNEGSYTDKVKVINAEAEGISVAGETLNAATDRLLSMRG